MMGGHRSTLGGAWWGAIVLLYAVVAGAADNATPGEPLAGAGLSDRPSGYEGWWTGSLLSATSDTMPVGHWLVEPYVVDARSVGYLDGTGRYHPSPPYERMTTAAYVMYGLADGVSIGMQPRFELCTHEAGVGNAGPAPGDQTAMLQIRLLKRHAHDWRPSVSVVLGENFPTGHFDHLAPGAVDGTGSGALSTTVSLYAQSLFDSVAGHPMRARINLSYTRSGSAAISDVSVYDTPGGFHGRVRPGSSAVNLAAIEYSFTQHWVFALDVVHETHARSVAMGTLLGANESAPAIPYSIVQDSSADWAGAPALEYNLNSRFGLIAGVKRTFSGHNSALTTAPAVAFNMVF